MTEETQDNVAKSHAVSDKEYNFAQLRKQNEMYQRMLEERDARLAEIERQLQSKASSNEEDDGDDEPYIDRRKLKKELASFGQKNKQETQTEMQRAIAQALAEERKQSWLKSNPDFHEVMRHAEKFAEHDPELAETILAMPEGFERQKLVYKNIKALGFHKPKEEQKSIQSTIDANRRSPYYQPTGVGAAPYASTEDYSAAGQKNAYQKMQELKNRLRLG